MYVTVTSGEVNPAEAAKVEGSLQRILPRVKAFPGVLAIVHYVRPEKGDDVTIIVWENQQACQAYRESPLMQEVLAVERDMGVKITREGYPVSYGALQGS
ncbi:MAG TPA: antibiotic biosynthesis monooxygenase [Armatimonadota bacterium]|jgi:quinol monooxygenase YgiN